MNQPTEAVFRIWNNRKRIEIEAAVLFGRLSQDISVLRGPADEVSQLAAAASADEFRHAEFCQQILDLNPTPLAPLEPNHADLGPSNMNRRDRVLYACVAMGCVTETLSTALLGAMRERAAPGLIKDIVHKILTDEVNHSRIGWAELALAARSRDIAWLAKSIPGMIHGALVSDVAPMLNSREAQINLSEWGILPPAEAHVIITEALNEVVIPGLQHFGIDAADDYRRSVRL